MNRKSAGIYHTFDRVRIEIPQMPGIERLVVVPMKVVYVNQCADSTANIDRLFTDLGDFADFCDQYRVQLE